MLQIRYWLEENRKKILIVFGGLFCVVLTLVVWFFLQYVSLQREKTSIEDFSIDSMQEVREKEEREEVSISNERVTVDIKGAIENPGVYEVEVGKRVQDVITLASGLKENADVSLINLSKKVEDEMVIIIYTKEEVLALQKESSTQESLLPSPSCPSVPIINDACITDSSFVENSEEEFSKISINQGSKEQLMMLPGIGESKAQAIIQYREENGGFQSLEELKNVNGIGDTVFAKVEVYISL